MGKSVGSEIATANLDGWLWYLVGPDQWIIQTRLAKVNPVQRPPDVTGSKWVAVDLYEQTLIAFEDDKPVFALNGPSLTVKVTV